MTAAEIDAGLVLVEEVGLSGMPVDVRHCGQGFAAGIRRRHSPDEGGLTRWIYAMPSRPEVDSLNAVPVTPAQRCLWTDFESDAYVY